MTSPVTVETKAATPGGASVAPIPRLSKRSTRSPASSSAGTWKSQESRASASPLTRTMVSGPSPSSW